MAIVFAVEKLSGFEFLDKKLIFALSFVYYCHSFLVRKR